MAISAAIVVISAVVSALVVLFLVEENRVIIENTPLHAPVEAIDGHNDHRIVMALAVILSQIGGSIDGAEAVRKSYPGFFEDITRLGAEVQLQ